MEPPAQQARQDLPNVPEEIFGLWLDEVVRERGWPPAGAQWEETLLGRSLEYWRHLKWKREFIPLAPADVGPRSLEAALRIVEANLRVKGDGPPSGDRDRFEALCAHVAARGMLPSPLVLVSTLDGYEVADGRRRIASMLAVAAMRELPGFFPSRVEAWVGAIRAA